MRVLVTGAAGFVGGHLLRSLQRSNHLVLAVDNSIPSFCEKYSVKDSCAAAWQTIDILDGDAVSRQVAHWQPEAMVHLAAIASVPRSLAQPERTYDVNVRGTLNLLRAFKKHAPAARLLIVSTAQVYGNRNREAPLREDAVMEPDNVYSESKAWADMLALLYAERLGMAVMTARPHNHTGPGQAYSYAVPAFARQVAAVAQQRTRLPLAVGNLDSRRDISDVRDVVYAYRLLLERGRPGRAYNIAAGRQVTMRHILEMFCRFAGIAPVVRVDPALWRPTDESPSLNTTALSRDTGWEPQIPLAATLHAVWNFVSDRGPGEKQ